jgi:argininosuccinate lyase
MQEDKGPLFDSLRTVAGSVRIITGAVGEAVFNVKRMRAAFDDSVFATDVADYLTAKGLPFRKAHEVAGKLVRHATETGVPLGSLPFEVYKDHSAMFDPDVTGIFDLERSCDRRSCTGGTGRASLLAQIDRARTLIMENGLS